MIPKKIHYCWFGKNEIPEKDKKCIESWKKYCPDYEIIEWNEDNYDITKNSYMYEAYKNKKWGFVSDYARLDIIYTYGGVYLDTDVELIRSIDDLLINKFFCGFEDEERVNFGLGYGAEKGSLLVESVLNKYIDISFYKEDGTLNLTPCPVYQTEILEKFNLKCTGKKQILQDDMLILPIESLCPKSFLTGELNCTENTYSIHHFNMSWLTEEDKIWIDRRQRLVKRFGIKFGYYIYRIIDFPYRVKVKIKNIGVKNTYKLVINRIFKRKFLKVKKGETKCVK